MTSAHPYRKEEAYSAWHPPYMSIFHTEVRNMYVVVYGAFFLISGGCCGAQTLHSLCTSLLRLSLVWLLHIRMDFLAR